MLLLLAAHVAAAQEPRQPFVDRSSVPWAVSVVHAIDLQKVVAQTQRQPKQRLGLTPSAPPVIYNVATGLVIDQLGHVVTRLANLNPGEMDQKITVTANDGSTLNAHLVGLDEATGFAVLSVPSLKAILPRTAETMAARGGALVRIISSDLAMKVMSSDGGTRIFLAPSFRESQGRVLTDALYSTASGAVTLLSDSFRSGSDSSVVTTLENQVIGIARWAGFGRAYVFPFAFVRDTVARRVIEKNANVPAGWLGIVGDPVIQVAAADLKKGVIIREVVAGSPAAGSGIQPNDIITRINNFEISGTADMALLLSSYAAGTNVQVDVLRNREPIEFKAVLAPRPGPAQSLLLQQLAQPFANFDQSTGEIEQINKRLEELKGPYAAYSKSPQSRERDEALREIQMEIRYLLDNARLLMPGGPDQPGKGADPAPLPDVVGNFTDNGEIRAQFPAGFWAREIDSPQLANTLDVQGRGRVLVDEVIKGSAADRAGLQAGDLIVEVSGVPLFKLAQLQAELANARRQVELKIVRNKESASVTIALQ